MRVWTIIFLVAIISITNAQKMKQNNKVKDCLKGIVVDDGLINHLALSDQGQSKVVKEKERAGRLLQNVQDGKQQQPTSEDESLEGLLRHYSLLKPAVKEQVKKCQMNTSNAIKRCNQKHGDKSCEVKSPGVVNKKCSAGLMALGATHCVVKCPEYLEEKGFYCAKKEGTKSLRYPTKEKCIQESKAKSCERWNLEFWVPTCKPGYRRVGADGCFSICPPGWVDEGRNCLKRKIDYIGHAFYWKPADN